MQLSVHYVLNRYSTYYTKTVSTLISRKICLSFQHIHFLTKPMTERFNRSTRYVDFNVTFQPEPEAQKLVSIVM